jgi:hypothetical protein
MRPACTFWRKRNWQFEEMASEPTQDGRAFKHASAQGPAPARCQTPNSGACADFLDSGSGLPDSETATKRTSLALTNEKACVS